MSDDTFPRPNYSTRSGARSQTQRYGSTPQEISARLNIRESDTVNGVLVGKQATAEFNQPQPTPASGAALSPTTGPVAIKTVASLQSILPQTEWLWRLWLPRGYITLLAGVPGVGKSAVALKIVESILTGTPWPDGTYSSFDDESGSGKSYVCWADTEASQALLVERCEQWELPTGRILIPTPDGNPLSDLRLDDQQSWDALVKIVRQLRPPVVVIDSLRGSYRGDENSSDLVDLLSKLAALARDHNCAVFIIHHLRKANVFERPSEVTLDRIRGSSAIPALCRVVWALDTPNEEHLGHMRLSVIKSNLGLKPDPVGVTWQDNRVMFCEAPTTPVHETQIDRAIDILKAYLQGSPHRAADVFEELRQAGISHATVNRAKTKLGIVTVKKQNVWWWSLPATEVDAPQ